MLTLLEKWFKSLFKKEKELNEQAAQAPEPLDEVRGFGFGS